MYTFESLIGRKSRVEDFLSEEKEFLNHQRILVTGAGGSIGSEIVLMLAKNSTSLILATDHDESRLHSLAIKINPNNKFPEQGFKLMDIRDPDGIDEVFKSFRPTVVIHAAALKHLSVLQIQPREALLSNVFGTNNVVNACEKFKVSRLVNISTDKAASPTSVLGKSKMLAELLVAQSNRANKSHKFVSCRFGNVFASRGSVVETFENQILHEVPLTLSDERVTRYFMETSEAAFLSIKSIFLGEQDLYIFDMGQPILMLHIARRMIALSGKQIPIVLSGLREGEKVHEELFGSTTNVEVTSHPLISGAKLGKQLESEHQILNQVQATNIEFLLQWLKDGTV